MITKRLLSALLVAVTCVATAFAAPATVEVGSFESDAQSCKYLPFSYRESFTGSTLAKGESLYLAKDFVALGASAENPVAITKIGYRYSLQSNVGTPSKDAKLYMVNTSDASYDGTAFTNMSGETPVWTGKVQTEAADNGLFEVELSTPFLYTGGNIRVYWEVPGTSPAPEINWVCGYSGSMSRYQKDAMTVDKLALAPSMYVTYDSSSASSEETTQVGEMSSWSQSAIMQLTESKFEVVYPAELLNMDEARKIKEISFPYYQSQYQPNPHNGSVTVYLQNTTEKEVGNDFSDINSMTLVYEGAMTWQGGTKDEPNWMELQLPEEFKYAGHNLRMVIVKTSTVYNVIYFGTDPNKDVKTIMSSTYGSGYSWETSTTRKSFPVTKFVTTPDPSTPTVVSDIYNWENGLAYIGDKYEKQIVLKGKNLTGDIELIPSNPAIGVSSSLISKADAEKGVTVTLSIAPTDDSVDSGYVTIKTANADDFTVNVAWTPLWKAPMEEVQVGENNSQNQYVPATLTYEYSKSEFVYTAAELGLNGAKSISKIGFPYVRAKWASEGQTDADVTIYLQNTASDEVIGDAYSPTEGMTKAFSGKVSFSGGNDANNPTWAEFTFDTPFEYTGGGLRVVFEKMADKYLLDRYFRCDETKSKYFLASWGASSSNLEFDARKMEAFPVMRITCPSVLSLDSEKWEAGDVAINSTYTKVVTVTAGKLNGGISISNPTTDYVKVEPMQISSEELEANGGTATFTITLNPREENTNSDMIVVSTRGLDDIEYPITWTPVLGYDPVETMVGEVNEVSAKTPLFNTWEVSESETVYLAEDLGLKSGSKIKRIAYPFTFNSSALKETVTISLANTTDEEVGRDFSSEVTEVATVVQTIPAGGLVEDATPFYWLVVDLPEVFEYNGANLRVRVKGVSDPVSTMWYFGNDSKKKNAVLVRFAESEAALGNCTFENKQMAFTKAYFPVVKITTIDESSHRESVFDLDSYSWVNGTAEQTKTYTKEITVSASNLKGDITISAPSTSAVKISATAISKADAEAGTAKVTVSITPEDLTTKEDKIVFASEGADAIEYPIFWTPVEKDLFDAKQVGEMTQWYAYLPLSLAYHNSKSEFVYTSEELGFNGENKRIKRIAYPYYQTTVFGDADAVTTTVKVYMQNTESDKVSESFTDFNDMTKVFEGEVTLQYGTAERPEWLVLDLPEQFLYTGKSLKIACAHSGDSRTGTLTSIMFANDAELAANTAGLYSFNDNGYDPDDRYTAGLFYPVTKFYYADAATLKLDSYEWNNGMSEIGKTYTKEVQLTADALIGDIFVSDPMTSAVDVEPKFISKEEIEANGGVAKLTFTLKPEDTLTKEDKVEIFSEGAGTIEFRVAWDVTGGGIESIVFAVPTEIAVYDLSGRYVKSEIIEGSLMEGLRSLDRGVYVVKADGKAFKVGIK